MSNVFNHQPNQLPILDLDCTFEEFTTNVETIQKLVPKNSRLHVDFDEDRAHLLVILPKEYEEIAEQLLDSLFRAVAGEKVRPTWLN